MGLAARLHGFCAAVLAQGLAPNVNIDVGKRSVVRLMQGKGSPPDYTVFARPYWRRDWLSTLTSMSGEGALSDWCRERARRPIAWFLRGRIGVGLTPNVNIDVGKRSVVRLMQGQGKMNPVPPSTPGSIYNFLDCLSPIGRTLANGSLAE